VLLCYSVLLLSRQTKATKNVHAKKIVSTK